MYEGPLILIGWSCVRPKLSAHCRNQGVVVWRGRSHSHVLWWGHGGTERRLRLRTIIDSSTLSHSFFWVWVWLILRRGSIIFIGRKESSVGGKRRGLVGRKEWWRRPTIWRIAVVVWVWSITKIWWRANKIRPVRWGRDLSWVRIQRWGWSVANVIIRSAVVG